MRCAPAPSAPTSDSPARQSVRCAASRPPWRRTRGGAAPRPPATARRAGSRAWSRCRRQDPSRQPPTLTRAFKRSNSSSICCRVCLVVPRISMVAAATADVVAIHQRLLVAEVQVDLHDDRTAARLLRQQRQLDVTRQRRALRARIDVGVRRIERFAGVLGRVALVAHSASQRRPAARESPRGPAPWSGSKGRRCDCWA